MGTSLLKRDNLEASSLLYYSLKILNVEVIYICKIENCCELLYWSLEVLTNCLFSMLLRYITTNIFLAHSETKFFWTKIIAISFFHFSHFLSKKLIYGTLTVGWKFSWNGIKLCWIKTNHNLIGRIQKKTFVEFIFNFGFKVKTLFCYNRLQVELFQY